jgi:Uma2 family endonuclease
MSISDLQSRSVRLGPDSNGMILTPEEFDLVTDYDDLYTYELIKGVVIVNPIPSEAESSANELLGHLLLTYQESHPQGQSLDETLPERHLKTRDSRRRADRFIWTGLGRRPDPDTDVPAIVVEFVSKRRRDRQRDYSEKRMEYLASGVSEYWVIDRFQKIMTVFRREATQLVVRENETYQTDLLPGFKLPLAQLLERADRWRDRD